MNCLLRPLLRNTSISFCRQTFFRQITTSRRLFSNYEGDGKTTVTVLNKEYTHIIMIDTLSTYGFRLNNGIFVVGPMATFPRTVLQWNVAKIEDITPESLSLFVLLEPKLDLLILGTGKNRILPSKETLSFLKEKQISAEILPTEQACSTFNFLNVEGRCVAGAFLPPETVPLFEEDLKMINTTEDPMGYLM